MTKSCRFWWFIVCLKCSKDIINICWIYFIHYFPNNIESTWKMWLKEFLLEGIYVSGCVCAQACTCTRHLLGYNLLKYFLVHFTKCFTYNISLKILKQQCKVGIIFILQMRKPKLIKLKLVQRNICSQRREIWTSQYLAKVPYYNNLYPTRTNLGRC